MFNNNKLYISLAEKEGWQISSNKDTKTPIIIAENKEFPLLHPLQIHLSLYRDLQDADLKFKYIKRANDLLWPQHVPTWNYWTERRFRAHCEGWQSIVMAAGAGCGKSFDAAKIALLFWLSDPRRNACVIASTTLESLESRIWGYVVKFVGSAALPIPAKVLSSKPPKIIYPGQLDKIHGMFAVAVRQGEDEKAISTVIGRHPDKGLMVVLDEATDMNPAIAKAFPNLEQGIERFQVWAIGNSNSQYDLHGAMSTPKVGWDNIDPMKDYIWETTQKRGICLYFNPYDSPAITEADALRRLLLGKFLITAEGLSEKKAELSEESSAYWRFVMGYWKSGSADQVIIPEKFISEHGVMLNAEWSGFYPLQVCAGLDVVFQTGGAGCVLRLAVVGHTMQGLMCIDFRKEELLFQIDIKVNSNKSNEQQVAEQVVAKLREWRCPLRHLAIDASGIGRALGALIKMVYFGQVGGNEECLRIVSTRVGLGDRDQKGKNNDPFIHVVTPSELWLTFREYLQQDQIKGLDTDTIRQIVNRQITLKNGKLILETKKEYINRMNAISPSLAHSPDKADSAMLVIQAAKRALGLGVGEKRAIPAGGDDFFVQKLLALQNERRLANLQVSSLTGGASRPKLLPNFDGSLEDTL